MGISGWGGSKKAASRSPLQSRTQGGTSCRTCRSIAGADGTFSAGGNLIEGRHQLRVKHEEFEGVSVPFELDGFGQVDLPDVSMKRLFRGFGKVVFKVEDSKGRPVEGAALVVSVGPKYWDGLATGPDGTLTIDRVPAGLKGFMEARKEGFAPVRSEGWSVNPAFPCEVPVVLAEGCRIEGTVYGPDGKPKPGQQIRAWGGGCEQHLDAVTGPDGRYAFENLAPGRYVIYVKDEKQLPETDGKDDENPEEEEAFGWISRKAVVFESDQGKAVVDFRMNEKGVLEGRLILDNCESLNRSTWLFLWFDGLGSAERSCPVKSGHFRLGSLAPGAYRLSFWIGEWVVREYPEPHDGVVLRIERFFAEVRDRQTTLLELCLPKGGAVGGRLIVEGSAEPPPRMQVHAEGDRVSSELWSVADGSFQFPYLPPGEYEIRPGYQPGPKITIKEGCAVTDMVIKLRR